MGAASYGHTDVVRALLAAGADVLARDVSCCARCHGIRELHHCAVRQYAPATMCSPGCMEACMHTYTRGCGQALHVMS